MMKIVHEKYKSARKYIDPVISEFQASFGSAIEYNKELESLLSRAQVCMKKLMATWVLFPNLKACLIAVTELF